MGGDFSTKQLRANGGYFGTNGGNFGAKAVGEWCQRGGCFGTNGEDLEPRQ